MKKYFNICAGLLVASLALTTSSCRDDEWDAHYNSSNNSTENASQLVRELEELGYSKMAQLYVDVEMDTILNSGLQFTIFAMPDTVVDKLVKEYPNKEDQKSIMMNATFFGSKDFPDSLQYSSLLNEKAVFEREEDDAFIWNYHNDTLFLDKDKMNLRIYNAIVHQVPGAFQLNENIVTFFEGQDSVYSRMLRHFSWDTLYYADGSEQKLPVFENGIITLANTRQLKFQVDSTIRSEAELEVINAENMEFLMVNNVRSMLNDLYEDLTGPVAKLNFAGFDPIQTIEHEVAADSMIYFLEKRETPDSIKFVYYKDSKTNEEKIHAFPKEAVRVKQLTGGNKVYFIDTLLVTPKYLTLLDSSIIEKEIVNVYDSFAEKGWGSDIKEARPLDERYFFFYPDGIVGSTASYWKTELGGSRGWAQINVVPIGDQYQKRFPQEGHYFQFRFDKEHFNTRKYQLSMIVSFAKNTYSSFNLSVVSPADTTQNLEFQLPLYALDMNGDTVPELRDDSDEIIQYKGEMDLTNEDTPYFELADKDFEGNELGRASGTAYKVVFTPFELTDYTKEMALRFSLGKKLPLNEKTGKIQSSQIYIHSLKFEMIEEDNNTNE